MIFETVSVKEDEKRMRGQAGIASLSPATKLAVQLAGLFHDVGHGPYSHVFELFCTRNPDFMHLDHHKLTESLIAEGIGQYHDIHSFLGGLYDEWKQKEQPYAEWKKDVELLHPKSIAAIAVGKPPPGRPEFAFLGQMISNVVVDADRMDYLLRDSRHCNVLTGGTDIWEIVHSFTLVAELQEGRTIWKLKIRKEAAKSVEALLTARDLAYRTVYYHPTHRVAQEMMIAALFELTEQKKELTPDEIALFTDDQLLQAFSEGTAFTKDVGRRIYFRGLYEPLPFRLNLRRDFDEATQRRVLELAIPKTKTEYAQRFSRQKEAAEAIGLPAHQTVIFDLQPVPVTGIEAYREPCLYDEAAHISSNLLSELRHLEHAHGRVQVAGEELDMHDRYIKETAEMQIGLPFEFLSSCIQELEDAVADKCASVPTETPTAAKKARRSKKTQEPATQETMFSLRQAADNIVATKLRPVFDKFIDVLQVTSASQRQALWEKFRTNMAHYLLQSARPRLAAKLDTRSLDELLRDLLNQAPQPSSVQPSKSA